MAVMLLFFSDDLQSIWAYSQATNFAVLNAQTPGFGFYRLAESIVSRQHSVAIPPLVAAARGNGKEEYQRLYETTTGAAAITESLQLARMLRTGRKEGPRELDIAKIPGIDIAEHPWQQMMGGKKPDDEPLARLIPHDNYFVTFKSIAKFIDFSNLLDNWGTMATQTWEVRSADYRLKERCSDGWGTSRSVPTARTFSSTPGPMT